MRAKIAGFSGLSTAVLLLPSLASAQTLFRTLTDIRALLNGVMILLITLAIVVFFWGLIKYIFNREGGEKEGAEGATLMIWGIIALFVMLSIWGIIGLLQRTFGTTATTGPIPQPPGGSVVGGIVEQLFGR